MVSRFVLLMSAVIGTEISCNVVLRLGNYTAVLNFHLGHVKVVVLLSC